MARAAHAELGLGWLLFLYATNGVLGIYGRVAFSWHMTLHMIEAMVVPIFLVLGAPVTLALRTLRPRRDGTLGPREMLLALVHSRLPGRASATRSSRPPSSS